ncbi:Eco57I restriction-modification methylase domain-containing protein [Chryseobacterium sp. KMC2]|uniref:Eco57I restriction-modification methylase domain-containing protein n=1 Tax=Chryseobacterium sp. KMC2 TaxID=2800705 RepID=UPI00293D4B28|nr:DNA methyltransferase [Chryseobacterium sp. KMC2]
MRKSELHKLLIKLNLYESVFFKIEDENSYGFDFHPDILNKINRINPDAIYVFNNQPLILFFDLTLNEDLNKESEIHKQVWSFDNSPIAFIINDKDISVYNALNFIKNKDNKGGWLEKLNLSEEEREERFSFWNLQSGETWAWFQDEYLSKKNENHKRVNQRLFQNIKEVRKYLTDKTKSNYLDEKSSNSLILRLIFIRYLIDRDIKIDDNYISGENINEKRKNFILLISEPNRLNKLFEVLNEKFNGVLFKETDIRLNQVQANYLANVFKGELEQQGSLFEGYFFEIFDFSIIPVEVISGIYESLIDDETKDLDSAVYTPSFLVDYILTDTVDEYLDKENISECKIFEVAVGSGIFLVQSLRRMIEKEIEINGFGDKKEFSSRIREIAKNNLFGIDINREALKVTCFSIYIALLDYQQPKDIDKYPFPSLLGTNLFEANFFDTAHEFNTVIEKNKPNFILGNPPWKSKKEDTIHVNWLKNNNKTVGRFEIAQSFLLRTKDFMSEGTKSALIVTSTIFYNVSDKTRSFKDEFLTTYCVEKFFDLSPVRRLIFEKKKSPASIIYYRLSRKEEYLTNTIKHHSVKYNRFIKYFKMLVLEKFDQKVLLQRDFLENDWMFKAALYGGRLDYNFIKKLYSKSKVSKFISENNAEKGLGVIKISEKSKTEPKYYSEYIGRRIIENEEVELFYTPLPENKLTEDNVYFIRGRKKELFDYSKILLKEQCLDETYVSASYHDFDSIYVNGVSGISFQDENITKFLYSYFISDIITYVLYMTSCSWGVGTRPAIRFQEEFLGFPFADSDIKTRKTLVNYVNNFISVLKEYHSDTLKYEVPPIDKFSLSRINEIINELYEVSDYQKDLINYTLNVSRYQFQESKQNLIINFNSTDHRNKENVLESYANIYIKEFEEVYYDEFVKIEIYPMKYFIAMNFIITDLKPKTKISYPQNSNEKEVLEKLANNLSIERITDTKDPSKNLYIQKDIKGFESDSFYIIKPNEYKCWHPAMAWYDVAEFKQAIQEAELERLNSSADD